jgi:hypothetical protein
VNGEVQNVKIDKLILILIIIIPPLINFLIIQVSSWREASQIWYREMLSAVTLHKPQSIRKLSKGATLECVCGSDEDHDKLKVCCSGCGRWQHAQCVGFKQSEEEKEGRAYCCPQCWQAQVREISSVVVNLL